MKNERFTTNFIVMDSNELTFAERDLEELLTDAWKHWKDHIMSRASDYAYERAPRVKPWSTSLREMYDKFQDSHCQVLPIDGAVTRLELAFEKIAAKGGDSSGNPNLIIFTKTEKSKLIWNMIPALDVIAAFREKHLDINLVYNDEHSALELTID